MDDKKITVKNPWIKAMLSGFGALALAIVLFQILKLGQSSDEGKTLIGILRPFVIGLALAYLVCPMCDKLESYFSKHITKNHLKLGDFFAIAISLLVLALIIAILIMLIVPQTYASVVSLVDTLPGKLESFYNQIKEKVQNNAVLLGYWESVYTSVTTSLEKWIKESLLPDMAGIITGVGSGVLSAVIVLKDIVIGIIVAIYALGCRHVFKRQAKMILYSITGNAFGDTICEEGRYANKMFTSFLVGKFIDSTIIGILCYIFCLVANMPNAVLVSVIVGITNIIPFFGPFIGAIPAGLLILIDSPMKALTFAIFIVILQQVDGNIIGPKILGDSTGLSSFWILFSIIVFGGIWGFIGMIIGVPLFAVIYDIVKKLVYKGLEKKGIDQSKYLAN